MIDLRQLRLDPEHYRVGAKHKGIDPGLVDELLVLDGEYREVSSQREKLTGEKNSIGKQIGQLAAQLKKASEGDKAELQQQMQALQQRPNVIKGLEVKLADQAGDLQAKRDAIWLKLPQPADGDVPVGDGAGDNVEISRWDPPNFDARQSFEQNKGFPAKSHMQLGQALGIIDFQRGVKMAGSRSYVLVGDGMRLHQAILRYCLDMMVNEHGFTTLSVPVLVREEMMVGTGFFPTGKEQSYQVKETDRGGGYDLYLAGTGEVGLMGYHQGEILDHDKLPLRYTTLSTCFRREAGAAGKDSAGLYRVHQFDKIEQVVICKADTQESRRWHKKMMGYVTTLLQRLGLPYRLLQCCTGDLGPKNADMIDIESWMPGRGEIDSQGNPMGEYGETHSASRLYDYQCRRLNLRYRDPETKKTVVCHALNNTVVASPRILVPIMEMYQNKDGSITIPTILRPYMNDQQIIEKK